MLHQFEVTVDEIERILNGPGSWFLRLREACNYNGEVAKIVSLAFPNIGITQDKIELWPFSIVPVNESETEWFLFINYPYLQSKKVNFNLNLSPPAGWESSLMICLRQWQREILRDLEGNAEEQGMTEAEREKRIVRANFPRFVHATNHPDTDCRDIAVAINRALAEPNDERSQNQIAVEFLSDESSEKAMKLLARIRTYERENLACP